MSNFANKRLQYCCSFALLPKSFFSPSMLHNQWFKNIKLYSSYLFSKNFSSFLFFCFDLLSFVLILYSFYIEHCFFILFNLFILYLKFVLILFSFIWPLDRHPYRCKFTTVYNEWDLWHVIQYIHSCSCRE